MARNYIEGSKELSLRAPGLPGGRLSPRTLGSALSVACLSVDPESRRIQSVGASFRAGVSLSWKPSPGGGDRSDRSCRIIGRPVRQNQGSTRFEFHLSHDSLSDHPSMDVQ